MFDKNLIGMKRMIGMKWCFLTSCTCIALGEASRVALTTRLSQQRFAEAGLSSKSGNWCSAKTQPGERLVVDIGVRPSPNMALATFVSRSASDFSALL